MIVTVSKEYFFKAVQYVKVGDLSELKVFGKQLYCRVGSARQLFGCRHFCWLKERTSYRYRKPRVRNAH